MCEIRDIIKKHAEKYPEMQPQDLYKLIYQNEFGGGHLIRDKEKCREYLYNEYDNVEHINTEREEYIGNGIVRINLKGLKREELDGLIEKFVLSAEKVKGNINSFKEKLKLACETVKSGVFSFTLADFTAFLTEAEEKNYPAVSHSDVYKRLYSPSYRVVLRIL